MGGSSVFPHSPLGAAAAVLLIIGTVFLGRAAKGRRVARRTLDHKETSPEKTEANVCVPDIFLSHSGKQKPFVERLYTALESANHTAFFDQHTLPKGFPFPSRIKEAARGCKIGVVVLSEEFLISKWPMIELEILVLRRGPEPCVLPLFYELNPADLKSPKKLSKWRHVWEEMAGEEGAKQWEQAVQNLKSFNGEVYVQGTSTGAYIDKVVQRICALIPCHVPYDCSLIQGQSRLAQEIAAKFEHFDASQACMVGLHGVGGLGKTTLCKVMVNYYSSHYRGRSCLIEFPSSGGGDSSTIALECKKALNKLTGASEEHLLNKTDSFDQVVQLMRDRVGRHDVFLAIDNVWESSLEAAKRVLQVGFSANSKILVTSRSEEVLKDMLMVRGRGPANNAVVAPLPVPMRAEAFRIFQEAFESHDLSTLENSAQMDKVLERCRFSGSYHVLALKALAKYVKRVCMTADSDYLSSVLEECSCEDLSDVEDVIRLNYNNLPEQKKHIFLDIVVLLKLVFCLYWENSTHANVQKWISFVHCQLPNSKITRLINELSFDGLIQIRVDKDGTKEIELHDLYLELALREIGRSPRLLIQGMTKSPCMTKSVEKMEREQLEIVMLNGDDGVGPCTFEKVQQCKWPKLKMFRAENIETKSGIWLESMPSLSVLTLEKITLVENESGSATIDSGSVSAKENVAQSHLLQPLEEVPGMPSLDIEGGTIKNWRSGFVRGEGPVDASCILHLNWSVKLRILEVKECSFVEEIAGLDALVNLGELRVDSCKRLRSLDGLSGLVQLQALHVSRCGSLQNLPDVSSLTLLEKLELEENEAMEEVGGLSCALKHVSVESCKVLERMPDVSSLTCLKTLKLCANVAMKEVEGEYLSSTLENLEIVMCASLRSYPSLGECILHLETLATDGALSESLLHKFPDLLHSTGLRQLSIYKSTCIVINVGCLTNLEYLTLFSFDELEDIGDLNALRRLKFLNLASLRRLKKLNLDCASLKVLYVSDCEALEEIVGDLKAPLSLEYLNVFYCPGLKKLEGISLRDLGNASLEDCGSVDESSILLR